MGKIWEPSGFIALPLTLQTHLHSQPAATHHLYLRPHDPKLADVDAPRSLFLVNIPVTTTEAHLKHLFTTQLSGGRIERVHFSEDAGRSSVATTSTSKTRSRKRKRVTASEAEASLDQHTLPDVDSRSLQPSGASAIAVFIDRPSMELSLKAARKAAKSNQQTIWGEELDDTSKLGIARYKQFQEERYPPPDELLESVNAYMSVYTQLETSRSLDNAKKRQVPDEEGFVTVTRGSKGGIRREEADELAAKQKKDRGLQNFYRFQMRERRKEQANEMLRKFEGDKRRVEEMRKQRRGVDGVGIRGRR